MVHFKMRKLIQLLSATSFLVFSSEVCAAGFLLWEQDAASVGNYHAGYAAAAYDASTAFYNPAGLNRFKDQQLVLVADNVLTEITYRGTVAVNTLNADAPGAVTARGGNYNFIPALHYVAPLSEMLAFGFSVDVPFGMKATYGKQTILRYASTTTSVQVIDVSPVLSFQITDQLSFGLGPDVQFMKGEFNQVGTMSGAELDSDGVNNANDSGYGMHAGLMYQFNQRSRIGLSYHSQVVHHLTGTSRFSGPLAEDFPQPIESNRAKVDIKLPPYTALSAYHQLNSKLAVMSSVIYTQWNTIPFLTLQNVAGVVDADATTNIVSTLPMHLQNAFNFSVGADYSLSDMILLRGGIGYDQTPLQNAYRVVQMPDNNRYALALGSHIQATPTLGFDLGWTHIFIQKGHIIPPPQVVGNEIVTTNGSVTAAADVLAAQLVWNMV